MDLTNHQFSEGVWVEIRNNEENLLSRGNYRSPQSDNDNNGQLVPETDRQTGIQPRILTFENLLLFSFFQLMVRILTRMYC